MLQEILWWTATIFLILSGKKSRKSYRRLVEDFSTVFALRGEISWKCANNLHFVSVEYRVRYTPNFSKSQLESVNRLELMRIGSNRRKSPRMKGSRYNCILTIISNISTEVTFTALTFRRLWKYFLLSNELKVSYLEDTARFCFAKLGLLKSKSISNSFSPGFRVFPTGVYTIWNLFHYLINVSRYF